MTTQPVKPYLTLPTQSNFIGVDFHRNDLEEPLRNRQYLDGFTAATEIVIKARFKVENRLRLQEFLKVEEASLALVVSANCPATRYRINAEEQLGDAKIQVVPVTIPNGLTSQQLILTAKLVVKKPPVQLSPLGASKVGSVLWDNTIRLQLEGSGSTFPTQEHEFRPDEGGALASWRFDFSGANLRGRASRVRLLINQQNKKFLKGILDNPNHGTNLETIRMFKYAVACSLMDYCSSNHEEFKRAQYSFSDKGSLGFHLINFLKTHIRNGNVPLPISSYLERYYTEVEYREKIRGILQSNISDDILI